VTEGEKGETEMQLIVQGKNVEVNKWLRQYVEKKIGRLDRYMAGINEAHVELSVQSTKNAGDRQVVQVTLRSNGTILRAEERSADMQSSIDAVLDKLTRRIDRYKGKRTRGRTRAVEPATAPAEAEAPEEERGKLVRTKRFTVTAMAPDEAIEQMELLGHDFFVFYNADSEEMNIVYRRQDGNYGLLEPEVA
jgi:putative sigma-54 modulation protein